MKQNWYKTVYNSENNIECDIHAEENTHVQQSSFV